MGGHSQLILVGVCYGTSKKGGLRHGHNPKRGVLGTGTMRKRGVLGTGTVVDYDQFFLDHYRPISVLPTISKILEKIVYTVVDY